MAETTSCWRSCSDVHAARASLKASSFVMPCSRAALKAACAALLPPMAAPHCSVLALTQLRASAKLPVTVPALAVSLAASASASMGIPSPNCEYAPVSDVVRLWSCCWLSPHSANRFPEVSTTRSVSPSTPMRSVYVAFMALVLTLLASADADRRDM